MSTQQSSTKQLQPVLGFWDLMGASVGQIIGAGIMTLLGAAIAMTGRSVPLAFMIAAFITIFQYAPLVFICGTLRLRGGQYTMVAMMGGQKLAGAFSVIYVFSKLSFAMYALSFASYVISLFGFGSEQWIAFITLTLFFALNCFGIDKFAAVQNLIVVLLVAALAVFIGFGFWGPNGGIDPNYFAKETWMTGGVMGLLQAGALLSFATGGANCLANLSAEAKRPTRDIPIAMAISTIFVAIIYGFAAFVAAGVLPLEQVAGQNLALVAEKILPYPVYVFFIFCGAGFALISTLNSQFAWAPKATMQACDDGWFPQWLAGMSRWNTPYILLWIFYLLGAVCIFTGLSVAILGQISLVGNGLIFLMINAYLWKLPKVAPEAWRKSKFRIGNGSLWALTVLSSLASILSVYLNARGLSMTLLMLNLVVIGGSFLFAVVRNKSVHMDISYEEVEA